MEDSFPLLLRSAIEQRGLSLERLRDRLAERGIQIGLSTLSCWQNGTRRPERQRSMVAVTELERILRLPATSLTTVIGPPRPRGRTAHLPLGAQRWEDATPDGSVIRSLVRSMAEDDSGQLLALSQHEYIELGAHRDLRKRKISAVVEAYRETDRHLVTYKGDLGCDVTKVTLRAGSSCRLGSVRTVPERGLIVAELLFDQVLRPGETRLLKYSVTDHSTVECHEIFRNFRFGIGLYAMHLSFHPVALPVRCHQFSRRREHARDSERVPVSLDARRAVHAVFRNVRAGAYGVAWHWE